MTTLTYSNVYQITLSGGMYSISTLHTGGTFTDANNNSTFTIGETITTSATYPPFSLEFAGYTASNEIVLVYMSSNYVLATNATYSDFDPITFMAGDYTPPSAACYLAGTCICTSNGDIPVEQLAIGDRVLTASGASRPIRWIGVTTIPARLLSTPEARKACLPMIVRQDAMQDGVPSRDLLIAPNHALVAQGTVMPVWALANSVTITPDDTVRDLVYYNVELDTVDVILVNRLPVLSLHPVASPRYRFDNCDEYFALYPDGVEHDRSLTLPLPVATVDEAKAVAVRLYQRAKARKGHRQLVGRQAERVPELARRPTVVR